MHLIVVTGMSGAGKSQAIRFFEDIGFFCIDNMPPVLIPRLIEMYKSIGGESANVALVIDARVGEMIRQLVEQVKLIKQEGHRCEILFLDANNATLVKRYKETRRNHPLNLDGGLVESISYERGMLKELHDSADVVIDTSVLKLRDLYDKLKEIYASESGENINIHVMAFGFKYGAPLDADLVFDVRCFPNPFYIEELKSKTGNDKVVRDYVMQFDESKAFMDKLKDMMRFLIPLYIKEGKTSLTIAIGCTGGKHRSVTMTNLLGEYLLALGYNANCVYRDIGKE